MKKKPVKIKKVFLSATYMDQKDCIEEVKSKLAEMGIEAHHFKEGDFYNGRIDVHSHDRCLQLVKKIPNYLLIVGFKAGDFYKGKNKNYHGLTITHAEFKAAVKAYNSKRRLFKFVRKEVWDFYQISKDLIKEGKEPRFWKIDRNLFPLLKDVENISFTDFFDTSIDLKKSISMKMEYFV